MNKLALMAVASMFAVAACTQETPPTATTDIAPQNDTMATDMGMGEMNAQQFASMVAMNDMLEIQASQVAQTKANNAEVKAFAGDMVSAHQQTTQQLSQLAQAQSIALPSALPADRMDLVENLQEADAEGFDDRYLDTVIDAHETAIDAFEDYAQNGENVELKQWAATTLPTLQSHLQRANSLRETVNRS
jgi:putative membrane protein